MKSFKLIILFISMALTGCSLFSPVKTTPPKAYLINTIPSTTVNHPRRVTLFVTSPDTRATYNTTKMAYTAHPYEISYFGENQWVETPSQMFLPLIVQTLQNSRAFKAVVLAPYTGKYTYILSTQIIKLQQNFMTTPATFELTVRAQLINANSGQVVAVRQFNVSQPMQARTPLGGVYAANQAAYQFLRKLTQFCVANS